MMAVNLDGLGVGQDHTGPTDDGYIEISTTMTPQDPYCCAGPDEDKDPGRQSRLLPASMHLAACRSVASSDPGLCRPDQ